MVGGNMTDQQSETPATIPRLKSLKSLSFMNLMFILNFSSSDIYMSEYTELKRCDRLITYLH